MTVRWRKVTGPASAEVALAVLAIAAGVLVYGGFFATLDYLLPLGLACLAGATTAAVAAARSMRPWSSALIAIVGLALVAIYGVFGDTVEYGLPTGRTWSAILHGTLNGWNRMLTAAVPADVWGELLMTPVLVVWAAAFSTVTLTLRTRITLAPLAPPLLAFVVALLVVGNQPGGQVTATIVFLAAAMSLVALRAQRTATDGARRAERPRIRPLVAAWLTVIAGAVFGIVGGQTLPLASGQQRFDPRTLQPPPITITDTLTPLARLKPQLTEDPPRTLFTVRMGDEDATRVDRVRTAALDAFDGTTWTSADTYQVAGSHLAVDPALTHSRPVSARVELKDLSGPYLPVLGWPSQLTPAQRDTIGEFGVNATSGMVVSTAPAVRGLRYDLVGEISDHDGGLPLALPSTTAPEYAYARALPVDVPAPLQKLAQQITSAQPTPYGKLAALELRLRSVGQDLGGPPGHSYAAIARLTGLTGRYTTPGYAEQNASAFTVFARALGFPARVAVGYRLRDYRDGSYTVTTADAHAWSEVHFAGYGWVVFDPTDIKAKPAPPPPPQAPLVVPAQPTPQPGATPANSDAQAPIATGNQLGFAWTGVLRSTLLVVITLAALVLLAVGYIMAAKAHRRRRRRQAPDHAAQVLGAWHEMIDRLTERGITPPVSLTAQEVAQHARPILGSAVHSIEATASLASTAVFAPDNLDQREAEQAWQLVEQLHTELYPRRLSVARLRAVVDPRPLWTAWLAERHRRQARERLELGRYL